MAIAFQITLIGMGLVFAAILLLWLVMALLVRFTTEKEPTISAEEALDDMDDKLKAAAAAVSMALASQTGSTPHEFPLPPTAIVSAWQVVMRSKHISNQGRSR